MTPFKRLESDSIVGSCDCQTKTPEVKYHKPGCKYRLISERDEARAEAGRLLVVESQQKDQIEASKLKLEFLKSKGITVGILKSSDCPQGQLAYIIQPNSELCDLKHIDKVIDAEAKLEAMREAIKEACSMFKDIRSSLQSCGDGRHESLSITTSALAKLQPFILP